MSTDPKPPVRRTYQADRIMNLMECAVLAVLVVLAGLALIGYIWRSL